MSTTENYVIPHQSSLIHPRYIPPSTSESSSLDIDPSGGSSVYVSFAKDEKKNLTPYEKLLYDSKHDQQFQAEEIAERRIGFYRIYRDIGLGNFSRVKLGVHLLAREKVAIKILDKTKLDEKTQRLLLRERSSMEKLNHPNIIRFYEALETPKKIYIVTEYAAGGDLYTHITDQKKLTENDAKHIFAQIVSAVDHMHSKGIIHRDIKSENVFFANEHFIKLGDFGFSTYSEKNQTLTTFCGSPPYAAPELYRDESYVGIYVDMWAMGVTVYFMVTGLMPFRAENVGKLKKVIIDGNYSIPPSVSNPCQELIRGLLNYQITERWSMKQIRSCTWLAGQSFNKEFDPFPSNLNNHSTDRSSKCSLEDETYLKLRELGIIPNSADTRDEINGTYRIIFHRLQKQSNPLEHDDSYDTRMKEEFSPTWDRSTSVSHENGGRRPSHSHVHNAKVCSIL